MHRGPNFYYCKKMRKITQKVSLYCLYALIKIIVMVIWGNPARVTIKSPSIRPYSVIIMIAVIEIRTPVNNATKNYAEVIISLFY